MPSKAPSKRRQAGKLTRLSPEHKQRRLEKRKRKKTWAARVWVKRHVKGEN